MGGLGSLPLRVLLHQSGAVVAYLRAEATLPVVLRLAHSLLALAFAEAKLLSVSVMSLFFLIEHVGVVLVFLLQVHEVETLLLLLVLHVLFLLAE